MNWKHVIMRTPWQLGDDGLVESMTQNGQMIYRSPTPGVGMDGLADGTLGTIATIGWWGLLIYLGYWLGKNAT